MADTPSSLRDRIEIAMDQVRAARNARDGVAEEFWCDVVDRLLDLCDRGLPLT